MNYLLALLTLTAASCTVVYPVSKKSMTSGFRCQVQAGAAYPWMQVDTGAESSHFYLESAKRLGLTVGKVEGKSVLLTDSSGVRRELTDFVVDTFFDFGNLRINLDRVVCLPYPELPDGASPDDRGATDGLLGMNVLESGVWWFDAPNERVYIVPERQLEQFLQKHGEQVAVRLPLAGTARHPTVEVTMPNGEPIELLLDTGADMTSLPIGMARKLRLKSGLELERKLARQRAKARYDKMVAMGLRNVSVPIRVRTGKTYGVHGVATEGRPLLHLPKLRLGNREVRDLVVIEDVHKPALGRDVLSQFDWILHGPRRELWLLAP